MADRPLIAIPARFSQSASALRFRAEVAARALVSAVYAAGGEPLLMHPDAAGGRADEAEIGRRLSFADGVLLPGGGDLAGRWSGQPEHPSLYDVDLEQDAFDLALLRVAIAQGLPVLAICRGAQLLAVANGGQLVQEMAEGAGQHRHRLHEVSTAPGSLLESIVGGRTSASCYHHQCVASTGTGGLSAGALVATAHAPDGTIEALELPGAPGWLLAVQWHPEDTAEQDAAQARIFSSFVAAAGRKLPA